MVIATQHNEGSARSLSTLRAARASTPLRPGFNRVAGRRAPFNSQLSTLNFSTLGSLSVELIVAVAILLGALLPLAYSLSSEKRFARAAYQHAVAMEIVDGEMEALLAGEWRGFTPGAHEYHVRAQAARNLPPGKFLLTLDAQKLRLEWVKQGKPVPSVVREAKLP